MANLNINVDIRAFPPARATTENVSARVAGEIERIYSYGVKYPTLVRVTPSYYSQTSVVYAQKSRQLNISSKEDLKKYRVGVVRGVKHTDDLVEGLVGLMERTDHPGPVNLGNPEEHTVHELAERVLALVSTGAGITSAPLPEDDPSRRCPDIGLARRLFGFSPRVGLEAGLLATIADVRARLCQRS